MKKVSEEIMAQRRLERLERLEFFMRDVRVPEKHRRTFALGACHILLTGFFCNSHWRVVWFCIGEALRNERIQITVRLRLLYYRYFLRLNEQEIDERF